MFFSWSAKAFGVRSGRVGNEGAEENLRYIRILPDLDVSEQASRDRVLGLIGENVLKNRAVRVTLDSAPEENTAIAAFIETLKSRPSLHFAPLRQ